MTAPKRRKVDEDVQITEMPKWLEIKPTGEPLGRPPHPCPLLVECQSAWSPEAGMMPSLAVLMYR